jgi:hypothetical protein
MQQIYYSPLVKINHIQRADKQNEKGKQKKD